MTVYQVSSFDEVYIGENCESKYYVELLKEGTSGAFVRLMISKGLYDYLDVYDLVLDWYDEYPLNSIVTEMYVVKLTEGK